MKLIIRSQEFDSNQLEELIQKSAWRLVRSAADRYGDGKGEKKRDWCVGQLDKEFPLIGLKSEDYVRAAYIHYKTERQA